MKHVALLLFVFFFIMSQLFHFKISSYPGIFIGDKLRQALREKVG